MAKIVEVPGTGNVEFPDGMSDDAIGEVLKGESPMMRIIKDTDTRLRALQNQPPGLGERLAKGVGETAADAITGASGLTSFLDPYAAALGALGSYVVPNTGSGTYDERFANEMKGLEGQRKLSQERSPVANLVGSLAPMAFMGGAGAAPGMAAPASSLGTATSMGKGIAGAAGLSAINAAGENAHLDPLAAAGEAATSPMNLLPAALPLAGRAWQGAGAAVKGQLPKLMPKTWRPVPSPAAAALESQGVPLTVGLRSPESGWGHMEAASAERFGGLAPEREQAMRAWREIALKKGLPPGMAEVPQGSMPEKISQMYKGFEPAYETVKGNEVYPAVHGMWLDRPGNGLPLQSSKNTLGAFDLAVQSGEVSATPAEREAVKSFLDNQLGLLPGGVTRPNMVTPIDAGELLKMRSNIRKEIRRLGSSTERGSLLGLAEDAVTTTLGSQLPPNVSADLAAADQAYARLKTLEGASGAAGMTGEFTPAQLGSQVRTDVTRRGFARGQGGELGDLARSGHEVFGIRVPKTGFAGMIADQLPRLKLPLHLEVAAPTGLITRAANAALGRAPPPTAPSITKDLPPSQAAALINALRLTQQKEPTP